MKIISKQKGQSTIEFLISFTVIFGLAFFIVKTTMNYGNGFYLHWATYAASRAYLTFETSDNDEGRENLFSKSEKKGKDLFDAYGIKDVSLKFNHLSTAGRPVLIGSYAEFESRFSPMSNIGNDDKVIYRSESFLGKEPPRGYCHARTLERVMQASGTDEIKKFMTVFDNGC